MDATGVITYWGLGSTVVLDTHRQTLTVTHAPPSEHDGVWVVPLVEIVDVHYQERSAEREGWAQIRTITSLDTLPSPAFDPYAFRNGGEQLKTFCVLIMYAARHVRMNMEGQAARDVIGDEMSSIRAMLDRLRGR